MDRTQPDRRREQTARHRDKHREERRQDSLDRYHAKMVADPDAVRAYRREWAKARRGILQNRAARSARRGAAYTKEAREWIASLVDPICSYCGEPATEIDHVVPLAAGGTGDRDNLVPACRSCNAKKGSRDLDDFLR